MNSKITSQRIKRRKISDEVSDLLIRDIQNGRYSAEDELPSESVLMKEFGVGRPAIRESLSKLARLGLVEIRPGVKPKVRKLDIKPMLQEMRGVVSLTLADAEGQKHLQHVRNLLETALARESARHATEEQLLAMRTSLDQFRDVIVNNPVRDEEVVKVLSKLDLDFHQTIVAIIQNPLLTMLQESLFDWLVYQRLGTLGYHGQPEITYSMHERIYEAIKRHDPDAAEMAMTEHLNQVVGVYNRLKSADAAKNG